MVRYLLETLLIRAAIESTALLLLNKAVCNRKRPNVVCVQIYSHETSQPQEIGSFSMFTSTTRIVAAFAFLILAGAASAAPTYFTNRADFQAAVTGGLLLESFESPAPYDGTHSYAGFSVSETGGINGITNYLANSSYVNPVTNGTNAIWFDDNDNSIGTFFNFSSGGVYAFGLDITTDMDSTVTIGGGAVGSSVVLAAQQSQFWGVIDTTAISSITFDPSGGPNIGFDFVQYQTQSSQVPEPGTLALLGLCLAGLAAGYRRKH